MPGKLHLLQLANSIFFGDYLTAEGLAADDDLTMIRDNGFTSSARRPGREGRPEPTNPLKDAVGKPAAVPIRRPPPRRPPTPIPSSAGAAQAPLKSPTPERPHALRLGAGSA
ncbi:hypothetical protein GCM10009690_03960 [Brevibacterium permense]|uniref:Biotin synthase n=1 Tax=Brevibacterium permense TaxID=234834 RepID=A0ABN1ZU33_9MICO